MKITAKKIKAAIQETIDSEKASIELHDSLLSIFESFEGKTISRRMATKLEKAMPKYCVSFNSVHTGIFRRFEITLWVGNYDNRTTFSLCRSGGGIYTSESFRQANACHGSAAVERMGKNLSYLSNSKLMEEMADKANMLRESKEYFSDLSSYDFPAKYSVSRMIDQ